MLGCIFDKNNKRFFIKEILTSISMSSILGIFPATSLRLQALVFHDQLFDLLAIKFS